MSGRRAAAILAAIAAAGAIGAAAAWFLGGPDVPAGPPAPPPDGGKPAPPPRPADPPAPVPEPVRRAGGAPAGEGDRPPTPTLPSVPKGWRPWARLRLVDSRSKDAVAPVRVRVARLVAGGAVRRILPEPVHVDEEGRVQVFTREQADGGVLPFGVSKEDWERARIEVRARGYEPREFASRAELEGERDLELTPAVPSVAGVLRVAPALEGMRIHMALEPADPSRDPRSPDQQPWVDGEDAGPFAWYDVPEGRWRLDVRIPLRGGDTAHARRDFEMAAGTVDLGEVAVWPPSVIRARVVARDGTGVLDRDLVLENAGAGTREPAADLDDAGWAEFRNLEADTDYRIVSSLEEGLAETVHTPVAGGGDLKVELKWNNEGVRCRIRFTVDGQDPIQWGDLFEAPALDKGSWKKDGFLEHDMAPGEYLFGAWARPRGKDKPIRVFAKFTVPERPLWEATVDMKEDAEK